MAVLVDRAVRVDPVDQRRRRGGGRDARLGPPARLHPGAARLTSRRTAVSGAPPRGSAGRGGRRAVGDVQGSAPRTPGAVPRAPPSIEHEESPCPSPPPRSTPTCSTGRRPAPSPTRRSTCSSSQTLNAAIRGFAEAGSDGIVQVSTGGAEYLSGPTRQGHGQRRRWRSPRTRTRWPRSTTCNIALHTDHCPKDKLDGFVRPLLAASHRAGQGRWHAAVPVAHVGRLGGAAGGEPRDRPRAAGPGQGGRRRSSRSRSASSAARRTASRAAATRSCTPRPRTRSPPSRRWAWARTAATSRR